MDDLLTNAKDVIGRAEIIWKKWEHSERDFYRIYNRANRAVAYATHTGSAEDAAVARELTAERDQAEARCMAVIDELISTNAGPTATSVAYIFYDAAVATGNNNWLQRAKNILNTAVYLHNKFHYLHHVAAWRQATGVSFLRRSPDDERRLVAEFVAELERRDAEQSKRTAAAETQPPPPPPPPPPPQKLVNARKIFTNLGEPITANSKQKNITHAFRRLSLVYHPDKGGNQEIFKNISAAHNVLKEHMVGGRRKTRRRSRK